MEKPILHWLDILIIVIYIIIVLIIGLWSSIKARGGGISGYFLAGRKMNWFLVGSSLFGSNIGSEHFIGLAGSGAASGIAIAGFEVIALFITVILGWIFVPVYIASGVSSSVVTKLVKVYTMPEYIKKRFGGRRIQIYLSCMAFLLSIFTKTAADLFAGAIFIKITLGWNLYWSILLLLGVACISTVTGGLRAVIWTDTCQVIIMVSGAICLSAISFYRVGGYVSMVERYFLAIPNSSVAYPDPRCAGVPPSDAMILLRSIESPDLPWLGATLGLAVLAVWYCCADQLLIQKVLSSRNYSHAKGGCVLVALYKCLPLWLMVFPGMIARILYPDEVGCTDPDACEKICFSSNGCTNIAYPLLVKRLLPIGLRGIMVAVMMSAIMSSLSSVFNSISSIFTIDIWAHIRKQPSQLELIIVGRLFILFMVAISVCWIPVIASYPNSQLFIYVQSVTSYLAPPVCATFVLAVLVPRTNEMGAFWGLMVGLIIGIIRFVMEIAYGAPRCYEEDRRPMILAKVHFLHFGLFLFVVVCIVNLTISLMTDKIDEKMLYRLTFWSRKSRLGLMDTENSLTEVKRSKGAPSTGSKFIPTLKKSRGVSNIKHLIYFLCGVQQNSPTTAANEMARVENDCKISLNEKTLWRFVTNILCISLVSLGIFVYVFWS